MFTFTQKKYTCARIKLAEKQFSIAIPTARNLNIITHVTSVSIPAMLIAVQL